MSTNDKKLAKAVLNPLEMSLFLLSPASNSHGMALYSFSAGEQNERRASPRTKRQGVDAGNAAVGKNVAESVCGMFVSR